MQALHCCVPWRLGYRSPHSAFRGVRWLHGYTSDGVQRGRPSACYCACGEMEAGDTLLSSTCWGGDRDVARRGDTHTASHSWESGVWICVADPPGYVAQVLGVQPGPDDIRGGELRTGWIRDTFRVLPDGADEATIARHARAYLFLLISGVLFGGKSGSHLQIIYLQLVDHDWEHIRGYSWGSACLAMLYRHLCRASRRGSREISGPLFLLQYWSWEHIHVGRPGRPAIHRQGQQDQDQQYERYIPPPRPSANEAYACRWAVPKLTYAHAARGLSYYRDALDRLTKDQMTWDPYEANLVAAMPPHLLDHRRSGVLGSP
ncbi:serine/threonine-protein phosphatase 7 long form homolog [Chenopodium quinoa]|uniref:serine/threonine-protein phosphatase 7 long form homolog n=1 Tax=Chenopodium quinoa TaxID=63459 RepID=UPI000B792916|nr:serine/threonine-protein phosphatase 7 long form homolog [Chenopodium quinoa]